MNPFAGPQVASFVTGVVPVGLALAALDAEDAELAGMLAVLELPRAGTAAPLQVP